MTRAVASALEPADIAALFADLPAAAAFGVLEADFGISPEADRFQRRMQALDCLESAIADLPLSPEWLEALLVASAAYLKEQGGVSTRQAIEDRLCRLAATALGTVAPEARAACLAALMPSLADLSLPSAFLQKGAGTLSPYDLFGSGLEPLRSDLCARIERLAANGDLWQQASPAAILWFWWSAAQEDRVYAFVKASMSEARSLSALLDQIVEPAETGGDAIAVRRWSKLVDFHYLEKHALQLALNGPSRDERRRARRFLEAYGNGKSELFR